MLGRDVVLRFTCLRWVVLLIISAVLSGCGTDIGTVLQEQALEPTLAGSAAPSLAEEEPNAGGERPGIPARPNVSRRAASKPSSAARSGDATDYSKRPAWMEETAPVVGSAQWKREAAETDRREEQIKRDLKSICRGC